MSAARKLGPLRLVHSNAESQIDTTWFCGRCAQPARDGTAPPPSMRVCSSCGLGLLLEARVDLAPAPSDAFVVVDAMLAVEAMSERAERLLEITEQCAIHRPIRDLIAPAGVEGANDAGLIDAIVDGATGSDELTSLSVRPRNTFGVRLRVRIGACGPPRAALVVFDAGRPDLRSV